MKNVFHSQIQSTFVCSNIISSINMFFHFIVSRSFQWPLVHIFSYNSYNHSMTEGQWGHDLPNTAQLLNGRAWTQTCFFCVTLLSISFYLTGLYIFSEKCWILKLYFLLKMCPLCHNDFLEQCGRRVVKFEGDSSQLLEWLLLKKHTTKKHKG